MASRLNPSIFICYPRALVTGLSLPMEMIASACSIARIKRKQNRHWRCMVTSSEMKNKSPVQFANGLELLPNHSLEEIEEPKEIFIPPIWGNPETVIKNNSVLIDWLIDKYHQGCSLIATGTGVCLLAQSGLLDGKVATTHWYFFEQFEKRYPKVNLQRQHFITQDDRITCTGSINALVDLVVYFIEMRFGKEVSQVIEQHYSHEINRTYDKPWFATGASRHPDEGILEVQQWMKTHVSQKYDLTALSQMANMSQRNFSRRFKKAVGKSVLAYGVDLKIKAAQELLRDTNLCNQDIADHLAYKDSVYFGRQFKQKTQLTPGEYRRMVRGKLFNMVE